MSFSLSYFLRFTMIFFCIAIMITVPVYAFTANSLDITVDKSGDAVAIFHFTLEGLLENAIPQSMLETELTKGLTTSSEPPGIISMDRSSATLLMKKFADTIDVPQGTEYRTASMDFKKAQIALKNSALSSVITADFSPSKITLTFPDAYARQFTDADVLPSLSHTVIDPSKPIAAYTPSNNGAINVTSSPVGVQVYIDNSYAGDAPQTFSEIAPGIHTLAFQMSGFETTSKTVTITAGKTTQVYAFLTFIPPTQTPGSLPVPGFEWPIAGLALIAGLLFLNVRR